MKKRQIADLSAKKLSILVQLLAFVCVSFAFSLLVIKNFSEPLIGDPDLSQWEYVGYYVSKNLRFTPLPQLDLVNNQVFYPYGTKSVFQSWGLERDVLSVIFNHFLGIKGWLQIYYLTTVLVTAIGTFILLFRDYGFVRASGAGFLVSFFNFYAIHKYPGHLLYAVAHWTVLSLITDFLIVKKVTLKQPVCMRLLLVRACLLILSISQELGYIAGFALMSFTISTLFIIAIFSYRCFKGEQRFSNFWQTTVITYKNELFSYPRTFLVLLVFGFITAYIYLPLVFQIVIAAKSFDFTKVYSGVWWWWTSPYRLLIPYFPGFNPSLPFDKIFADSPEGFGAGSPGWFLLIIGTVGLWQTRKRIIIFIPLLTVFLLCLFYHPETFPTLKIFPWFAFNRVAGRVTVIYPVILVILSLEIHFDGLGLQTKRLVAAFLVGLACVELYTAYSFKHNYQPSTPSKDFFTYMNYVKNQPGEAVLDWPFCVTAGNGIALIDGLCPYFFSIGGIPVMSRFHEKKIVSQYFGRLHPSQIEPFLQAGWPQLFVPNKLDAVSGTQQTRCFTPEEWSFFTDFYKFNDFAGINLYVDLLPEGCASEFYKRFGTPVRETRFPPGSRMQFIPKSPELRRQVNLALGKSIRFDPPLDLEESNLLKVYSPRGLRGSGLFRIEDNGQGEPARWAIGPETLLSFRLRESKPLELTFRFVNPIEGQDVAVEINGVSVANISNIRAGSTIERRIKFQGVAGVNRVIFRAKDWNHHKTTFIANDPRLLAIQFKELAISSAQD
jgi:hypothetical protein